MNQDEIQISIKSAVSSGAAVCLFGAGFSRLASDGYGSPVPTTEDLTREIKSALEIEESENANLAEMADFAEDTPVGAAKLREILLARLTCTSPTESQRKLARAPWRAIFTTNFDDVIEQARDASSFTSVTPATDAKGISAEKTPIYYLHGRARDLLETDKNPSLIISERNYLQIDSKNRDLYARFYNELFAAQVILIVGYSIRDLEIAQGILSRSSALFEKTFIVCHEGDSTFAKARLAKFGRVLPIGVDGLSELIGDLPSRAVHKADSFHFLNEVSLSNESGEIDSDDFIRLVLRGTLSLEKLRSQISDRDQDPFCVDRSVSSAIIFDNADAFMRRFIVSSDFGNGKTIFLRQLSVNAIERGNRVLLIESQVDEAFAEIDAAIASGEKFFFIIDDVVRYREMAKYIGTRLTNSLTLVCTTRGEQDERAYTTLSGELGGAVRHIDLNRLNASEIDQWDEILERWGYWEQRIELSKPDRQKFLIEYCASENRSIILSLFRTSKVAERIDRIVEFFLNDTRIHVRAFAALLISSLAQRHLSWESLVAWLNIDETRLRSDIAASDISDLFQGGRTWNGFTSSQLAEFILRNRFVSTDRDVLLEIYTTIVLKSADSANDVRSGFDARENLKELMKFRFLTRLFGNEAEAIALIGSVYRRLSKAPRIRSNPQFWLQFAMSRMEVDDLEAAETYLETALGRAKERGQGYSPFQILDQRARLYLIKNARAKKFNATEVTSAIKDLSELLSHRDYEIIYPFRAVPLIHNFLEQHIDELSTDLRGRITDYINGLQAASSGMDKLPRSQKGETKVLYGALRSASLVLRNA